jgi:hypothetical protein
MNLFDDFFNPLEITEVRMKSYGIKNGENSLIFTYTKDSEDDDSKNTDPRNDCEDEDQVST